MFAPVFSHPAADNFKRCYQKLDSDCYYVLKKKPPGIEEFEFFWVGELDRPGFIFHGSAYVDKTFYSFEGTLKGTRIAFALSLPVGITYRFEGTFIPGGRDDKKIRIAIEGRLIKQDANKKVKARNVKLFVCRGYNQ
jgi:hypothetical protein